MSAAPWIKHVRAAFCAGVLALAAGMAAGNPAWAQLFPVQGADDDEDEHVLNTDKRLIDRMLTGLGVIYRPPEITYRERSPLVVPPGRDLPPPGTQQTKNPTWPVDPEVKARKEAAAARKKQIGPTGTASDPSRPIAGSPEMMQRGQGWGYDDSGKKTTKEPDLFEMLRTGRLFSPPKNEIGTFTGEPPRTSLVEPPPGYLTPSPKAPYGVTDRPQEPAKKDEKL